MIPKPIYELLPYLYVVSGTIAMLSELPLIGTLSGAALGMTGLLIIVKRREYRQETRRMQRAYQQRYTRA